MTVGSNDTGDKGEGIFVVRETGDREGDYAICVRVATLTGGQSLVGFTKTVADLVDEKPLMATFVIGGSTGQPETFTFEPQSGENVSLRFKRR